jgi:hypothetical protein
MFPAESVLGGALHMTSNRILTRYTQVITFVRVFLSFFAFTNKMRSRHDQSSVVTES